MAMPTASTASATYPSGLGRSWPRKPITSTKARASTNERTTSSSAWNDEIERPVNQSSIV